MKPLADNKINMTIKLKYVSERAKNILGKGEIAGYHHFILFPKHFQKPHSLMSLKVQIVWQRVKSQRLFLNTVENLHEKGNKSITWQIFRGKSKSQRGINVSKIF